MAIKPPSAAALTALALAEAYTLRVRYPDMTDAWAGNNDATTVRVATARRLATDRLIAESDADTFFLTYTITDAGRQVLDEHGAEARAAVKVASEHRLRRVSSVYRGGHPVRGMRSTMAGVAECSCGERIRSNDGTSDARRMWKGHLDSKIRAMLTPFDAFCAYTGINPDGSDGTTGQPGWLYNQFLIGTKPLPEWWKANGARLLDTIGLAMTKAQTVDATSPQHHGPTD